jgi:type III secretion protein C
MNNTAPLNTALRAFAPRHALAALLLAAGAWAAGTGAQAAAIAWDTRMPMPPIVARDMPMQEFMQALVASQSISVVVSAAAAARTVNGRFSGNAARAFESVVRSSALLPYFDGGTLYIYTAAETQRATVTVSPASAQRLVSTLNQLRLHDGRFNSFNVVPASGLIQLTGSKPFVEQVQEVVRSVQLSAPASPDQLAVYPLRHAWAWDVTLSSGGRPIVVPGIASLLRTLLGAPGPVAGAEKARASVAKLRGRGFAAGAQSDVQVPSEPDAAATEASGAEPARGAGAGSSGPTVTAEIRSNSVVVRDTPDRLPQYADLIKALDVEPVMVELEATIVEVNSDRLRELGVNWRILDSRSEVRLGRGDNSDLGLRGPTPGDVTPSARGLSWSTILDRANLIARITALAATGNARVISRAQVATLANLESSIQSSETAFVRVGGFQEVDLFPVTATTNVRITPHVFERTGRQIVSLVVDVRDGRFSESITVDGIPNVKEVALSTNGLVPDNLTFVIGGFRQDSNSTRADKVPLLGDLPVVGAAFRSTTDQVANSERLFLVTPKVLNIAQLLERVSVDPNAQWPDAASVPPPAPATPRPPAARDPCSPFCNTD